MHRKQHENQESVSECTWKIKWPHLKTNTSLAFTGEHCYLGTTFLWYTDVRRTAHECPKGFAIKMYKSSEMTCQANEEKTFGDSEGERDSWMSLMIFVWSCSQGESRKSFA